MIAQADWKWFGCAGHFILGSQCRFHLCTQVGPWLVSTVGEYFPTESVREILAEGRKVALEGRGDAREYDYMRKIGFEDVGFNRKYETMVFRAGKPCVDPECNCGWPKPDDYSELECRGYNLAKDASEGHFQTCLDWAAKEVA